MQAPCLPVPIRNVGELKQVIWTMPPVKAAACTAEPVSTHRSLIQDFGRAFAGTTPRNRSLDRRSAIATDILSQVYFRGLLRRTPAPPPFSFMNSTPAFSNARRIASSFAAVNEVTSSATSALRTVFAPTDDSRARSAALHLRSARAALI
jgi:hypothetical protein